MNLNTALLPRDAFCVSLTSSRLLEGSGWHPCEKGVVRMGAAGRCWRYFLTYVRAVLLGPSVRCDYAISVVRAIGNHGAAALAAA
eukprot:12297496-Prorocentrum_lima.AAC.1